MSVALGIKMPAPDSDVFSVLLVQCAIISASQIQKTINTRATPKKITFRARKRSNQAADLI
jgi:hypothetical protein